MTERKQAFLNDLIITNQHGVSVGGELNQATYVLTPGTEVVIYPSSMNLQTREKSCIIL